MTCTVEGCEKAHYARGWCIAHWRHHRATQTAEWLASGPQPIHGTRRRYAKGCRCDACSRRESEYRAAWRLATGRTTTSTVLGGQP